MRNINMMKYFIFCLLAFTTITAWPKSPFDDWKEKIIKEGRQKLASIQEENAINDVKGLSSKNHYLIVVGSDTYPDGEFITQRKGIGQGAGDDVYYLLNEEKIASIDNILSAMNSSSEIKTYVLIVRYMPMEFKNELSNNQDITDFFIGQKTDLAKAMAKPVTDKAAEIVSAITSPVLSKSTSPTLYCGFVNFKVFQNEFEGLSQWVYYPRNNNVKYDEEYGNILASSISRAEWPSGSVEKVDKLVDLIKSSNSEYTQTKGLFADLIAIDHPIKMQEALKGLSINALSAFNIGLRLHILKVLSAGVTPGDREIMIINLINSVQTESDANQLITGFKLENDKVIQPGMKGWCLLKCMTSQTSDGLITENYKALIKALVALCKRTPAFKDMVAALNNNDNDKIADRIVYYNYNSFWSKMTSTLSTFPRPLFDRSTVYSSDCQLQTNTELFFKYIFSPNDPISSETLDPLEPIVFVNQSDLGMLGGIDASNIFVSPAIILKYADEKAWNQTASDVSMAAIDAASLATGYGELKAGVMGVRQAWVLVDMFNSGINLSLNASLATENRTVKEILGLYNIVTGGISLTRMATGGVKGVYGLIKGKNVLDEKAILDLLKALDDGGDDALKNLSSDEFANIQALVKRVKTEAGVKGLSQLEQLATKVLDRMESLAKGADDILRSITKVEEDLRKVVGKEHVYKIDSKGIVKGPIVGEPDKVDFTSLGPFNKGDVLTHNHPKGTTFSFEDIAALSDFGITEVRAVAKSKTYSIIKTGEFKYYEWRIKYDDLENAFKIKYADKIKAGLTFDEMILIQEEIFLKSFEGFNIQFKIYQ
ncbi:MAG TPA: hypothetical protein VIM65_15735 [Cyclobacteriaceae bacterium]